MNLSSDNMNLFNLVKMAYNGEVVLPNFQRNFVWARNDIEEFIMSLLENVFIGTFLIQQVTPNDVPFGVIPVEDAYKVNKNLALNNLKPRIIILDG